MASENDKDIVNNGNKTMIMGHVGSGKTFSLPTFIRTGLEYDRELHLAVLITDPGGEQSLLDGMQIHAPKGHETLPLDRLHYVYIPPASPGWSGLKEMAKMINRSSYQTLTELKAGISKQKCTQFLDMLSTLTNFKDQHGNTLGPVDDFDENWMLAFDSMSGINKMAKSLHVGFKPTLHQGEWGVSMSLEEEFIVNAIANLDCFVTFTAHMNKDLDILIGGQEFMPAFLGKALAPQLPRWFSDVVLQKRDGDTFNWSTTERSYSCLKARNLALKNKLPPDFFQLYKSWDDRRKLAVPAENTTASNSN